MLNALFRLSTNTHFISFIHLHVIDITFFFIQIIFINQIIHNFLFLVLKNIHKISIFYHKNIIYMHPFYRYTMYIQIFYHCMIYIHLVYHYMIYIHLFYHYIIYIQIFYHYLFFGIDHHIFSNIMQPVNCSKQNELKSSTKSVGLE